MTTLMRFPVTWFNRQKVQKLISVFYKPGDFGICEVERRALAFALKNAKRQEIGG